MKKVFSALVVSLLLFAGCASEPSNDTATETPSAAASATAEAEWIQIGGLEVENKQNWKHVSEDESTHLFYVGPQYKTFITIMDNGEADDDDILSEEYQAAFLDSFSGGFENYKTIDSGVKKMAGNDGLYYRFEGSTEDVPVQGALFFFEYNSGLYTVMVIDVTSDFDDLEAELAKIMDELKYASAE